MKKTLFILVLALPIMFAKCSKDNEQSNLILLKVSEKTLYHGDEYQIEASSNSEITYSSENKYHAIVSENGLITAMFVGETNILLSNGEDSKTFKVIVTPKYNLYPEPDVKFGDTKSSIISKFGTPYSVTETELGPALSYLNYSNTALMLIFLFDESDKMIAYDIVVASSFSSVLIDFLSERYSNIREQDGVHTFINGLTLNSATVVIDLSLYNSLYWQVIYTPNSLAESTSLKSSKSSIKMNEFDEILNQLQK